MPTSPTIERPRRDARAGFTLIELMLALAVMAIVASLALPFIRPEGGPAGLRAKAYLAAALFRGDRAAARRSGRAVVTGVRFPGPQLRSGSTGAIVDLSPGLVARATGFGERGVTFYPDGRSSGGVLALATSSVRLDIAIDEFTSAVTVRSAAGHVR